MLICHKLLQLACAFAAGWLPVTWDRALFGNQSPANNGRPSFWDGVWQGTLGVRPVRACFNAGPKPVGSYYYLDELKPVSLEKQGDTWVDWSNPAKIKPRWTAYSVEGGTLRGKWLFGPGDIDFQLERVPGELGGFQTPCGSVLFNQPRVVIPTVRSQESSIDGLAYHRLVLEPGSHFTSVSVETFSLAKYSQASAKIDAVLANVLENRSSEVGWLSCMFGALDTLGRDGEYFELVEPTLFSGRWLSVTHHVHGYCGGPTPFTTTSFRTFDLMNGVEVDVEDWLSSKAVDRTRYGRLGGRNARAEFLRLVAQYARAIDEDCWRGFEESEYWSLGLTRQGFKLLPTRTRPGSPCRSPIEFNLEDLMPFLNENGLNAYGKTRPRSMVSPAHR